MIHHYILPPTNVRATKTGMSGQFEIVDVNWTPSAGPMISYTEVRYHYGAGLSGAWVITSPQLAANAAHYTASISPAPAGSNLYISVCGVTVASYMVCSEGVLVQ